MALQFIMLYALSDYKEKYERMIIAYAIAAVFCWIRIFRVKPCGLRLNYAKYALAMGIPTVFHVLANTILSQSDRVMMENLGVSASEIGIYSLYYNLIIVLSVVLSALNNSWAPYYYDYLNEYKYDEINKKIKNYIELFTVLSVGFLMISREVGYIMGDSSYWSGIEIILILVFSVYFTFMYQFPVNFEFYHRYNSIIAIGTIVAGMINIGLNSLLIPYYGMYGAAFATTLSYGALFISHYIIVRFCLKKKYHTSVIKFIPGLVFVTIASVLFYMMKNMWAARWMIGVGLGIIEIYRMMKRKSIF